jgi:hypothetical protein
VIAWGKAPHPDCDGYATKSLIFARFRTISGPEPVMLVEARWRVR